MRLPDNRILIFNPTQRLIAICQSAWGAANIFKTLQRRIHQACKGDLIAANGFYFRYLPDDIEVTVQDLGVLKLKEYDELCGIERRIYPTNKMSRKGMKYKTKKRMALEAEKAKENENPNH